MESKYLNFPITLLRNFFHYRKIVLENIFIYAIYVHAERLEHGSITDRVIDSIEFFDAPYTDIQFLITYARKLLTFHERSPMTGISLDVFLSYYRRSKSEWEDILLLAFCALKSIIGPKKFAKITNQFLLSRMDGEPRSTDTLQLSHEITKYESYYHIRKIKFELMEGWGLKTYSRHTRGFYASFKMQLTDLVLHAEKNRIKARQKYHKKQEAEAVQQAMLKLKNMP